MHRVLFYQTAMGSEIIKDWLRSFDKDDRAILGEDLLTVQFGFPMGLPLCRSLGQGLWEVRSTLSDGRREARMIFYHDARAKALVVLHAFIKKSRTTPRADIDTALKRKREFP
jgi:phage-related protein